ncbi:hypothetical protein GALL_552010 [mine drainage metagenome]|uniref:Uncharacterized protein n=1 Tax=mine drainage metagenome TaxID=410659 RepID=A0A1J5NWW2_9ZZZZ
MRLGPDRQVRLGVANIIEARCAKAILQKRGFVRALEVGDLVRSMHLVKHAQMRGDVLSHRLVRRRHQRRTPATCAPLADISQHILIIRQRGYLDLPHALQAVFQRGTPLQKAGNRHEGRLPSL